MKISIFACLHLVAFAGLLAVPCSKAESGYAPKTVYDWDSVLNAYIPREICAPSEKCECGGGSGGASGGGSGGASGGSGQGPTADPMLKCVQMDIGMGAPRYSALSGAIVLQLNELQASSRLYSPAGFHVVAGHTVHRVSHQTNAGGVPKWVQVSTPSGVVAEYVFADGESVGVPVSGREDVSSGRLAMVDAQGWAAAADPAFYDYYPGDGSRWRFGAAKNAPDYLGLIEHQTPQGRVETKQDLGLEILRDADGVLRQVATPARLADFVITGQDAYDLTVYPNDASCVTGARTAEGYCQIAAGAVPEVVWKFRNPTPGVYGVLEVTREMPGAGARTWRYEYVEAVQDFILKHPGGIKEERVERIESEDKKFRTVRRTELGPDGVAYSKKELRYETRGGSLEIVASVKDPGGLNLTTVYDYYTGGVNAGLESLAVSPEGSWTRYEYDGQKRKTAVITPWLDAPTNAPVEQCAVTRYGYGLFAPGDFLAYNDQRPRTEIKEICGVEVSRTYHAYSTNALGQAQEIEERAAFPGAPYGHASNPRTVKTYYAASAALPLPGRLATVVYPGGKTETYDYDYGTFNAATFAFTPDPDGGAWRETVTTSYGANSGVQSLRSARVWNEKGLEVLNESYVEDGAAFALIGWKRLTYDRNGKLIETAYSDGRVESATWGANCCGKESATSAEGIGTIYGYNELKQKVSETKKGLDADGSGDITTLRTYDLENHILSTAVTNVAAGLGYFVSRSMYDAVGRVVNAVDRLGNTTITSYDKRATTVQRPNGVTAVTDRYLDGQTKSVLENGVVKQSYAYGANLDGTRWILFAQGLLPDTMKATLDCPNVSTLVFLDFPWALTITDPVDRNIAFEKPGFGHTVLVTSNRFDSAGNLIESTQFSIADSKTVKYTITSASLYAYSADGTRRLSCLDSNTNGVVDLSGPDRITGSVTAIEKNGDDWWQVSRSWGYPEYNSLAAVTTSIQRVMLTGLGVQQGDGGVLISLTQSIDVRGNVSKSETLIDRANKTVNRASTSLASTIPAVQVTVNGLLQSTVSASSVTNTYAYDPLGRQSAVTNGRGNTAVTVYNLNGQVAYTEDAAFNRTSNAYDALGRRTTVTDALGNVTHTSYDASGRVVKTWGVSYPVDFVYDSQGSMISMKTFRDENGAGDETRWLYENSTGLLTNKVCADGLGSAYSYTPDGKLAARVWARGVSTIYGYDTTGSLVAFDYSDATPDAVFTYGRMGQQISAVTSVSTNLFVYSGDTLDLVAETQNGATITRFYDTLGRVSGFVLGEDYGVSYSYDEYGRFKLVAACDGAFISTNIYSYAPGSDLPLCWVTGPLTFIKNYEPTRDLLSQVRSVTSAGVISQYDYTNDAIGRRTLRNDSGLTFGDILTNSFSYNARSEVVGAVMHTNAYGYVYDSIGNRLISSRNSATNTYVSNLLNQYVTISNQQSATFNPTYDDDGNLLISRLPTGDWYYTWDAENRLVQASNATVVVSFTYDYQSRRISKTVNGAVTRFYYDDWAMVKEIRPSQALKYYYGLDLSGTLQGAGTIGGLWLARSDLGSWLYTYDGNGNVSEIDNGAGTVVGHFEYDPFGNMTGMTGPDAEANPFRASTKYFDVETGLSYYGYRYYSPDLGRWVSRDPLGDIGFRPEATKHSRTLSLTMSDQQQMYRRGFLKMMRDVFGEGAFQVAEDEWNKFDSRLRQFYLWRQHYVKVPYTYINNNPIYLVDALGLAPQKPGCDGVPDEYESPCNRACCDDHDACYTRNTPNDCNCYSWLGLTLSPHCVGCNIAVTLCFTKCAILEGLKPRPPPYTYPY